MRRNVFLFGAGIVLATCPIGAAQAATVVNGSFEGNPANDSQPVQVGDSTTIHGWTVINSSGATTGGGKEIAWLANGAYGIYTPFGNDYLDLTGYSGSTGNSGVSQTISTVIGGAYTLSFYLGQFQNAAPVSVLASAGTQSMTITDPNTVGTLANGTLWSLQTFNFTATSDSTTLSLYNGTTNTDFIGLDNVSISGGPAVGGVPEPASWAMMIVGFGMIGAGMRYRKRRTALRYI